MEKKKQVTQITLPSEKITLLQEAFAYFDEDGSGLLSVAECHKVVQYLGYNPTMAFTKKRFEDDDTDKSGSLDFFEFCEAMIREWDRKTT